MLITMQKDSEKIQAHETQVEAWKSQGWLVAENQVTPETEDQSSAVKANRGRSRLNP